MELTEKQVNVENEYDSLNFISVRNVSQPADDSDEDTPLEAPNT